MKKALILSGIVLGLFVVSSFFMTKIVYDQSFPRFERFDDSINASLRYEDIEDIYERELFNFKSSGNILQGYLYPIDNPLGLMVIVHGLGGGADSYIPYAKWFLDQGFMVLMYDATGSFDSEGDSTKGFPQSLIDLEAALNYISEDNTLNRLDLVLFGHSWGGYAVANSLYLNDSIKAVVVASAPYKSLDMTFEQAKKSMGFFTYTQWPFLALYERLLFGNYTSFSAIDAINESEAPVLIIHGLHDDVVDINGSAIMARRNDITNPNAHFMTRDLENRDGHNDLFRSLDAVNYLETLNIDYRALYETHDENIPYELKQAFYAGVDRFLVQELDEDLMQAIYAFLLNALSTE